MDKCREEFQKAFPIPAHWIEFDEKANRYYCPYVADATASTYQSKWVVWQHQQAKVEELQTQLSLQRQRVKAFEEELTSSRNYGDELQKRVDAATRKWIAVTSIATTCPNQLPDEFFQKLDELHDALCGYELEQALKGEGQ
ncbi:hypothetical protein [Acinetobacter baumannii]|uniref:hypothetical protein n=1 Tax=Acinetobacter baumannii TaxID=470 RepID=UPI0012306131|nr:hypothetical protein [Acinetobacter baumannii]